MEKTTVAIFWGSILAQYLWFIDDNIGIKRNTFTIKQKR